MKNSRPHLLRDRSIGLPIWITLLTMTFALDHSTAACADGTIIKKFSCDTIDDVITKSGVATDRKSGKDNKPAIRLTAGKLTVFKLFEVDVPAKDNTRLVYRAAVKTKDVKGKVFLEMWCHIPNKGEFFSRGLDQPLTGTTEWSTNETPFFLKKGDIPDKVKLNLVVDGSGTAWINDVALTSYPLQE
ncbi:MAG: hypothetical protein K2X29_02265 [Candidatus Obscuribacterales bacterium]|nr:hypothetical protein [Candidatus Obscuribacterales bacterium]